MNEIEFSKQWERESPIYLAWGKHVCATIVSEINLIFKKNNSTLLKIPPEPRLKDKQKLLEKAFRRNKNYNSPYKDITDKVGIRFVVLTTDEVALVCKLIDKQKDWKQSRDKDFETDKSQKPEFFDYQSVHYIVRPTKPVNYSNITIPIDTPCEIQVRSLLQHAWAEMTHDTVYKPNIIAASAETKRLCARAIALTEVVDEIFCRVSNSVQTASEPLEKAKMTFDELYTKYIKSQPSKGNLNTYIIDAYINEFDTSIFNLISAFFDSHENITKCIQERAISHVLFRQPAIMLVYYLAHEKRNKTKTLWPLVPEYLHHIYTDLGISFH